MAISDGTVLVPDEFQDAPVKPDPLKMSIHELSVESPDWLRAVRDEVEKRRGLAWAEMRRLADKAGDRNPTRNQQAAFDDAEHDLDALTALRDRINEVLTAPTRAAQDAQRAAVATPIPTDHTGAPSMTSTVPTDRGALLGPETRMADYLRAKGRIRGDEPRLDLGKALRGLFLGRWDNAEAERRAMAEGSTSTGGALVPQILSAELIDLARNSARVMQAGARLFPMESEVESVPRQISDPTVSWRLENSQVGTGNPTFDLVTFNARSLATIVQVSRELLEDAKQNIDDVVRNAIAKAIALEIDRVALYGSGTAPQPQGLKGASNVPTTSLGTNGATPTYDVISTAVQTVRSNNFEPSGVIYNPRTAGELARLKDSQGRYLQPPGDIAELPMFPSNQVPTNLTQGTANNASDIFVGDWSQLWIGTRTQLGIQTLVERYADYGQVAFLAWWRGDVQVAHPLAFDIATGSL